MNELLTKDNKPPDLANEGICDTIKYQKMLEEAFELIAKLPDEKLKEIMEAVK